MTLRRTPSDFLVREVLEERLRGGLEATPDRYGEAAHAVYRLKKTSLSTPEAVGMLAGALRVKAATVSHAGLKDKHAETEQHVSVELPKGKGADSLPERVSGQRWEAERLGWVGEALSADAIAMNRFELVVRGLSQEECRQMGLRARAMVRGDSPKAGSEIATLLIVNYFGDQRFGSARHGEGFAAQHLIRGDFEGALKLLIGTPARKDAGARRELTRLLVQSWGSWKQVLKACPKCPERAAVEVLAEGGDFKDAFAALPHLVQQMSVEAFQSFLWNDVARRMVATASRDKVPMRTDDEFGEMLFPVAAVAEGLASVKIPMPAEGVLFEGQWATAMRAALDGVKLEMNQLRIPGLRRPAFGSADRPLIVEASEFQMTKPERDELAAEKSSKPWKRRVTFSLPRGAYATVVMRALGQ